MFVSSGRRVIQIGFKTTIKMAEQIEEECEMDGTSRAEFLNDAVKYYINYRETKRIFIGVLKEREIDRRK